MANLLRKPGVWVLIGVAVLPLLVALPRLLPLLGSGSTSAVLRAFGIATGVLGLSLMLLAAAMSVRLPRLDRWFGGLPQLWGIHRAFGFGGFILIMVHALVLGLAALPGGVGAALSTLSPGPDRWVIWAGWLALLTMVVFLGPTFQFFGRPPHYQRWKKLHLLSALATVLALVHALPLAGELILWVVLAVAAIGAIVWRKGLSPRLGRHAYEVAGVDELVRGMVEIRMKPLGEPMAYHPGQFAYLTPHNPELASGHNEEHPYTISSAPHDPEIRMGIKALGDASAALQTIPVGSQVQLEGPYGDFFEAMAPGREQLWIGGGVGITPFVSGARAFAGHEKPNRPAHLIYLANDETRAYYLSELQSLGESQPGLTVTAHYYRQEGPLSVAFLQAHCPDFAEREVYLCGPPPMTRHVRKLLRESGVPSSRIHSEAFDFL